MNLNFFQKKLCLKFLQRKELKNAQNFFKESNSKLLKVCSKKKNKFFNSALSHPNTKYSHRKFSVEVFIQYIKKRFLIIICLLLSNIQTNIFMLFQVPTSSLHHCPHLYTTVCRYSSKIQVK